MKKLLGVVGGRVALFAFLLFFAAGCKGGGLKGDNDIPKPSFTSFPSGSTFGGSDNTDGPRIFSLFSEEGGSGDDNGGDNGGDDAPTITIAKVHNPEPASMLLMSIGLAAMLRRRRAK